MTTLARLLGPGGTRAVLAETLLIKHQLMILNRSRRRAPNLTPPDWKGCPFARAVAELPAELDHPAHRIAADHKAACEAWFQERFAAEEFVDPSLLARQIMVLLDGAITELAIHRDEAYAEAAAAAVLLSMHDANTDGRS